MNVGLRAWEAGDAEAVFACIDDEILFWIPVIPRPYSLADAQWFVENCPDDIGRAVVLDGEVVGSIGMRRIFSDGGHIGYWCAPRARGRGVMTAALTQHCAWAFTGLGMLRLELVVDPDNVASQRLAERVGFQREGVLRSSIAHPDGRRRDSVMYSLLPGELRAS